MLLGTVAATVLPYLRKLMEEKVPAFAPKYFVHLIIAAIWEFFLAWSIVESWTVPTGIVEDIFIIILAFTWGYGGLEAQKQVEKWIVMVRTWRTINR